MSKIDFIKRYLFIIRYVRQHPYCTKQELLTNLNDNVQLVSGVKKGDSDRTLTRDIREDIPDIFRLEIEYCPTMRGYYISDEDFENSHATQIIESFDLLSSMEIAAEVPDFIVMERRKSRGTEHLVTLAKAIKESRIVTFEYSKFYPENTETRNIEPYVLKESRGRWYLLGFDSEGRNKQQQKNFGLDRIHSLKIGSKKGYKPRKDIDWNALYDHCFAMFTDAEPERVVIKFDHRDGNYVESMPIHHSQKITKHAEGVDVELYVAVTMDFIMELMSRSWSIEIIEPASLRERMEEIYSAALVRNRSLSASVRRNMADWSGIFEV